MSVLGAVLPISAARRACADATTTGSPRCTARASQRV